jgi:hypothetical protein
VFDWVAWSARIGSVADCWTGCRAHVSAIGRSNVLESFGEAVYSFGRLEDVKRTSETEVQVCVAFVHPDGIGAPRQLFEGQEVPSAGSVGRVGCRELHVDISVTDGVHAALRIEVGSGVLAGILDVHLVGTLEAGSAGNDHESVAESHGFEGRTDEASGRP